MPEETTTGGQERQLEPLSYGDVLDQYQKLSDRGARNSERLEEIVGDKELDVTAFSSGLDDDDIDGHMRALIEAGRAALDPEQFSDFAAVMAESSELKSQFAQLETEGLDVVKAVLAERVAAATNHLDWDRLIEAAISNSPDVDPTDLFGHIHNHEWNKSHGLSHALEKSEELAQILERHVAYQKAETGKKPIPAEEFVHGNLAGAVANWSSYTWEAIHYTNLHRQTALQKHPSLSELKRIRTLAAQAGLDGEQDGAPGTIADAIEHAAAKRMKAFDEADVELIRTNQAERPNALMIKGAELLKESTGIDDPNAWLNNHFDDWPEWFTRGIGFVDFLPTIDDEDHTPPEEEAPEATPADTLFTTGQWAQALNRLQINARNNDYRKMLEPAQNLQITDEQQRQIQAQLLYNIELSLVHELTHNSHQNTIPISWLRRWHETTLNDPVAVTSYVERSRKTKGERQARREDLCESMADYRLAPARLFAISRERFERIQELMGSYPPYVVDVIVKWNETIDPADPSYESQLAVYSLLIREHFKKPQHRPKDAYRLEVDEV
jgi:hypothetical protein